MATIDEALKLGVQHHQAGRFAEADRIYRQIIAANPEHAGALHLLGVLSAQAGRLDDAVTFLRRVAWREPQNAEAQYNLGNVLHKQRKFDESIPLYRQAIALNPDLVEAHSNLGKILGEMGQFEEAIAECQVAIRLKPDLVEAHNNMGSALVQAGRFEEAIGAFKRAIQFGPNFAQPYCNLGGAFMKCGHVNEAIACFQRAVKIRPDYVEAHYNLGVAFRAAGNFDGAIDSYRRVIEMRPDYGEAHNNLGNALKDSGRIDEAIDSFRRAGRFKPEHVGTHSNLVYCLSYHPAYDAKAILAEAREWNRQRAEPLSELVTGHTNWRDPERRLRIGYVGADFREHCQLYFTIPLFSHHDPKAVEIYCYSNVTRPDAITEQIRGLVKEMRPIVNMSDVDVAEQIRCDEIDILVDLTMHMSNGRPLVFARKPAPVQVAWLAYPGTTGMEMMDYRLTDPYLDPIEPNGGTDQFYSEKSVRLAETFWCYDPLCDEIDPGELPAATYGFITFGSLNNFCKVNDSVLRLWARVIKAVEGSRMMILCPEGRHRESVLDLLEREGVDRSRVELVTPRNRPAYLELYRQIDIGLDTLPYNGHTTSLDSFWMGVPVITLEGRTVVGRAGVSQLSNLGMTELIARTSGEFVEIAWDLSGDLSRLAEVRRTLRGRMKASPLMDGQRFAHNLEGAFREMWKSWCSS